jgi:hypothetical protein
MVWADFAKYGIDRLVRIPRATVTRRQGDLIWAIFSPQWAVIYFGQFFITYKSNEYF